MSGEINVKTMTPSATAKEFGEKMDLAMKKSEETGRPFFILILQIENLEIFAKRRPPQVVNGLFRELYQAVRKAVHPSQYVGRFQGGLGLLFDRVDVGDVDTISRRLVALTQHVIRTGQYNDMSSRWTDIIYQFLHPNRPGMIFPKVGWAVYPRDGRNIQEIVTRAIYHAREVCQ